MSRIEQLKSERQARIKMYRNLKGGTPIAGIGDSLPVEGNKIPFKELINIHAGSNYGKEVKESRWFYRHEASDAIYMLSACYDGEGRLCDVQTKSIKMTDLAHEVDGYDDFTAAPKDKPLLKQTHEERIDRAERVMGSLKGYLAIYGYCPEDISYTIDPGYPFGGAITLRFMHPKVLESRSASIIIKSVISKSFGEYPITDEDQHLFEYMIYVDFLEDIISVCPSKNWAQVSLMHYVLDYIDDKMGDDFIGVVGAPTIRFHINQNYLGISFFDPAGRPMSSNHNYKLRHFILTAEDSAMAHYLVSLNTCAGNVKDNRVLVGDIIEFIGMEKFGYSLHETRKAEKVTWLEEPETRKLLRKDRIQMILDSWG